MNFNSRVTRDELSRLLGTPVSKATDLYRNAETGERQWYAKLRWDCSELARARGLLDVVGPSGLACSATNALQHGEIDDAMWCLEPCMIHDLQFRHRGSAGP